MTEPGQSAHSAGLDATSREAIELALDAGRMGVFSWDAVNDVVVWDARIETLFGVPSGSFGGRYADWVQMLHPEDRELATTTVEAAMKTGASFDFEHRVVHPDGSIRWLEGRGQAIVEGGRVVGVRGVTVDITDRKRVELELAAAQRRLGVLARAGDALASAFDIRSALRRLGSIVVPQVADAFEVALLTPSGELRRIVVVGPDDEWAARRLEAAVPLLADHPFARAVRDAVPVHVHIDERPDQFGPASSPLTAAAAGLTEGLIVPLFDGSKTQRAVVGVLSFGLVGHGRTYDANDVEFVRDLASRVSVAIERSRSYEREREVAERLQHALLPDAVPSVEGIDVAVRYRPAAAGVQVGGDWYDVVAGPEGVWISVGDVVGHGVEAAAIMGRARSMLRALTIDELHPERALTRLDAAVSAIPDDPIVTVVLARLSEPRADGSREVSLALAGHPPAVVVGPDGDFALVGEPQLPAGATGSHQYKADTVVVRPGSLLLFFTDGLVERRREVIDEGIQRLAEIARERIDVTDVERIADDVLAQLHVEESDDDLALVVVRVR